MSFPKVACTEFMQLLEWRRCNIKYGRIIYVYQNTWKPPTLQICRHFSHSYFIKSHSYILLTQTLKTAFFTLLCYNQNASPAFSNETLLVSHVKQATIANGRGQTLNSMAWQMKITERACHSIRRCVTTTRSHNCTEYGKQGADFTNESAQTWPSLTPVHWWIITLYNLAPFCLLPFDPLRIRSLSITFINFKPGYNLRVRDPTCSAPMACWPPCTSSEVTCY